MAGLGDMFNYLRLKLIASFVRVLSLLGRPLVSLKDRHLWVGIERKQLRIPSRGQGRFIDAFIYYPPGYSASSPPSLPLPLVVNWHGSGFVIPALNSDRTFCTRVARELGVLVLDADYRKAPEHPFPAAINDIEDTLRWVASRPHDFQLDRVAFSGFSAGGNLALVAASSVIKSVSDDIQLQSVVAFYPPTNISIHPGAKTVSHPKRPIPVWLANAFNDCYTPDAATRRDPRVSPAFAERGDFPQSVAIITCSGDTLCPEANELASQLNDGSRKVRTITLDDVTHAFDKYCPEGSNEWKQREIGYSLAVDVLKEALL